MAKSQARPVTRSDLERAVRAIANHFNTDRVFVIGSQALLVGRLDIEEALRMSEEFDMYFANAGEWEAAQGKPAEASEEINAHFGEGSHFHQTHGFYIDGVDESTAVLPEDWRSRAKTLLVDLGNGGTAEAIAPEPTDIVVAKLVRGDPKDVSFASICFRHGLANPGEVKRRLNGLVSVELLQTALGRLDQAIRLQGPSQPHQP